MPEIFKKCYDAEELQQVGEDIEDYIDWDDLPDIESQPDVKRGWFTVTVWWQDDRKML